jgi:DNA-binding CsgD family transcriptional regulator
MPPEERGHLPEHGDFDTADEMAHRLPGEVDVVLRLLRTLLDRQLETVREVESILVGLVEASLIATRDQGVTVVKKLSDLLTEQESKVLEQICLARTNRQIGRILGITEKTAKNYVQAVFRKLRVHSRTEAALMAIRYRWFGEDADPAGSSSIPGPRHEAAGPSARRSPREEPDLRSTGTG